MRFLDPDHLKVEMLGKAFPLSFSSAGQTDKALSRPYIHCAGLLGGDSTDSQVDTGFNVDGGVGSELFRRKVQEQKLQTEPGSAKGAENEKATFPVCAWEGGVYTNVTVRTFPEDVGTNNVIGLSFLARHLVTLDFPGRTLYLKQESIGPRIDEQINRAWRAKARAAIKSSKSASRLLTSLNKTNHLPGFANSDQGEAYHWDFQSHPDAGTESVTFDCRKTGEPSIYHYEFTRTINTKPWRLKRAWRTDQNNRTLEAYPVP